MELKLNFKEAPKFINERNQKSLFLFLLLPWISSVAASISATSLGLVFIVTPKNVNDSILGFIFRAIPNDWIYIIVVAVCNFMTDLFFFSLMMFFKNKFEINKRKVVTLILIGHVLAVSLYFLGLMNENAGAIAMSLMRLFLLGSTFYIFMKFLPQKYVEILLPYSLIFTALEIQTLRKTRNKPTDNRVAKNSKRRIAMYTRAMLLTYVDDRSETDLISLLRKQVAIDEANSNENKKVIQDFCNYLNSSYKIQIPTSEIAFDEETPSERLLRRFVSSLDTFLSRLIFFVARYSMVLDLEEKTHFPVTQSNPRIPTSYDNKIFRRLFKYHLDRAKTVDAISAKQKLYAFIFASFLSLIFPTILYILGLREDGSSAIPNYRSTLLFIQYLSTFVFAILATNLMRTRYREAGIDVTAPNKLVGYFANGVQFLIFFIVILSGDKTTYIAIIPILSQNIMLLLIGIAIAQLAFLFMLFKPPVELKKSSFASSLLVRELLLLYSQILGARSISNRRRLGRYIYFTKKYLNLIAKDLIYSRFDANTQKTRVREYFRSISDYLDNLGAQIKLGGEKNRIEGIDQIKTLILFAAIEDFGEIPDAIPEFQRHLEIKSIQPKRPSLVRQIIQVFDTSPSFRMVLIVLLFIIINSLYSSLWVDLQNLSSLFQIMTP
jgi:hypothetical protein